MEFFPKILVIASIEISVTQFHVRKPGLVYAKRGETVAELVLRKMPIKSVARWCLRNPWQNPCKLGAAKMSVNLAQLRPRTISSDTQSTIYYSLGEVSVCTCVIVFGTRMRDSSSYAYSKRNSMTFD